MTQVSIGIFRLISAAFRAVVVSNTMAFCYVGVAMLFNGFIIQLQDVSPAASSLFEPGMLCHIRLIGRADVYFADLLIWQPQIASPHAVQTSGSLLSCCS